jgi:hypothetical protein
MKHRTKSASPGELAYSIDDPPRPVSTSQNSSMGDVYLSAVLEYPAWCVHRLWCPHLSDHPTRRAKPTSYEPTDELCTFSAQISAVSLQPSALGLHLSLRRSFAMSLRRRSAEMCLAHKVARKLARKWHVGIFKNPNKTRKLARKTHSFFSEDPNVNSRSACSAYPYEKNRNTSQPLALSLSLESFVTTFRKANNSCWAPDSWRAGAANFAYSVVQRIDHLSPDFPTQNAFLKLNLAAIFSLEPLALSLSPQSRSACSAYPFEKNLGLRLASLFPTSPFRYVATSLPCSISSLGEKIKMRACVPYALAFCRRCLRKCPVQLAPRDPRGSPVNIFIR